MIKIIKRGKIKRYRAACPECGCVFEFDKTDIKKSDKTLTPQIYMYKEYIVCPCCKSLVYKEYMELIK